jgi:CDP-glucose 4,6-dehydratase
MFRYISGEDYCFPVDFNEIRGLSNLSGPVLITGHTGFKGTWLTMLLEELGIPVVGLSLPPTKDSLFARMNKTGSISESFFDITNYEKLEEYLDVVRPGAIFHLAAQPLVIESYKSPRETFSTNAMGTANLLSAAFRVDSIAAIGVITTDKVYRNENSGVRFQETDPLAGKDPYSASKVAAEAVAAAWQQIAIEKGGPRVTVLRAGNVIGGGDFSQNRIIPDIIRAVVNNSELEIRNPNSTRPWQHVLDPLSGYLLAISNSLKSASSSNSYNFGPREDSLEVKELVNIASDFWGVRLRGVSHKEPISQSFEATQLGLDSTLAERELSWISHWNQLDSIRTTFEWWDKVLFQKINAIDASRYDIQNLFSR